MAKKRHSPLSATYRLQFNAQFTFQEALKIVNYLHQLGVSHIYASPVSMAKPGSLHGYDVVDHCQMNPEIGTEKEFEELIHALHEKKMGLLFDMVPNHMYIVDPANHWWFDVLENGPSSPFASYFAIEWHPPQRELENKVLLPILDDQYGNALENQSLQVIYEKGTFSLKLPSVILPTDPKSWMTILEPLAVKAKKTMNVNDRYLLELQSIITALHYLPMTTELDKEKINERLREKEVIKKRLEELFAENKEFLTLLKERLSHINGKKGTPESFDELESFVSGQPYRLSSWRVANDEINYRRFFDIFEYVGIHTEKQEVFNAIHNLVFQFMKKGLIDGLRIDHIDGLLDPEKYLLELQEKCQSLISEKNDSFYLLVEKILVGNEKLRSWPIDGTVGYDFLNQLNGIYVFQSNKRAIQETYQKFTGNELHPIEMVYDCKKFILVVSLSSELSVVAHLLDHISEQHRSSRDFTAETLRTTLRDVIACFPVYRSYIHPGQQSIEEDDQQYIRIAIARAKRLNPAINASIFDFIQTVLLLEHPLGITEEQKNEREDFVLRFQQLTAPAMAKGLEDTAFYRSFPLSSLNEVGADPYGFGVSESNFHKKNLERFQNWPRSLNATSTHDTKRSEDVRARINILSEIPEEWEQAIFQWKEWNQSFKIQDGDDVLPDANDEYLLYQTLVGTWPLYPMEPSAHIHYMKRIQAYMEKAVKEAKVHSSWINPNPTYDQAVQQFIQQILNIDSHENRFLNDFKEFMKKIIPAAMLNSISQLLLKCTAPGIPDIYQGNEIWDFSLVDPDNRKPIDYSNREYLLNSMLQKPEEQYIDTLHQYLHNPEDGRLKMFITLQTLNLRKKYKELFNQGNYQPLTIQGEKKNHIIAFARSHGDKTVIVIASRYFTFLMNDSQLKIPSTIWQQTQALLPQELSSMQWHHCFTGETILPSQDENQYYLNLSEVLHVIPIALLESENKPK